LPTRELPSTDDIEVDNWLHQFAYVTRFRGQLAETPPQSDIIFVPAPDFPDTPPLVDLNEYVDPLHFWGCSTRIVQANRNRLLDGMWLNNQFIEYPHGWIYSYIVGLEDVYMHIFSPEPVTIDTLHAFFDGQMTPPMLIYFPYQNDLYGWDEFVVTVLGQDNEIDGIYYFPSIERYQYRRDWHKSGFIYFDYQDWGVFLLLTTQSDVHQNQNLYQAIEQASLSYPYYAHRSLRHTLFLTYTTQYSWGISNGIMIGFPQGWIEHTVDDEIIITPQNRDEPSVQIIPLANLRLADKWNQQEITPILARYYGVLEDDFHRMRDFLPLFMKHAYDCGLSLSRIGGLEFEKGGRRGFITLSETHLVIASAPHDVFPHYQHILKMMIDSVRSDNVCG